MKKNILKSIVLSTIIALTISTTAFAEVKQQINLKIDGVLRNLDTNTTIKDNVLLINTTELSKLLYADLSYSNYSNTATLKKNDKLIVLNAGTKEVVVNGQKLQMPIEAQKINNELFIPARFIAERLGAKVTWLDKSKTFVIETDKKEVSVLNLKSEVTDKTKIYSYKTGLAQAIENSNQLKNIEGNRDILDDNIEKAKDQQDEAYYRLDKAGEISAKRLVKNLQNEKDSIKDNIQMIESSVELNFIQNITKLYSYLLDKQLIEKTIELENLNIKNMTLKHQLGYESDFNIEQEKIKLKSLENQKSNLMISIKNTKQIINMSLGRLPDSDVFFDYDIKYSPIANNITTHVINMTNVDDDPKLKIEKRAVDYVEYVKETTDSALNESDAKLDNDILIAKRKQSDLIASYEKNLYANFNSLKQLEEARASLKISYDEAKNNYNLIVINFEAGNKTMYDVYQAQNQLLKLEIDLLKNQLNYDSLKYIYNHPYLS